MAEASRSPLFTVADAWSGGFYEASFIYPPESDLGAALAALWSFPALAGPVSSRSPEPWDQHPVEPAARYRELCGVVSLPGGGRSACATYAFSFERTAEMEFSIPLGSLALAWPEVESFPFGATSGEVEAWEPRLESLLVALAEHVHKQAPFRRALTGFEGIGRALTRAWKIPARFLRAAARESSTSRKTAWSGIRRRCVADSRSTTSINLVDPSTRP